MGKRVNARRSIADLVKLLSDAGSYKYRLVTLFRDFVTVSAIALQNGVEQQDDAWYAREKEYLDVVSRYDRPMLDAFAACLGGLINLAAEEGPADHLGEFYMALGISEKGLGQFFTPYHVSKLMAAMAIRKDVCDAAIAEKGYLRASEPTCGGGGMVVAIADAMAELGYDVANQLQVYAQDIDLLCCRMTYISCVLHNIPAVIIWGDTLKMEERTRTATPALFHQLVARGALSIDDEAAEAA